MIKEKFNPFELPETQELLKEFLIKLPTESGRGALLIATTRVDEILKTLLVAAFPNDIIIQKKDKGILSKFRNFGTKIETCYAFRLINKQLYDSLNALRELRNEAAHSAHSFQLHDLNKEMEAVYNTSTGLHIVVKNEAMKFLISNKVSAVADIYKAANIEMTKDEFAEKMVNLFNDEKIKKSLEKQVPYLEIAIGLSFLCALIIKCRNDILKEPDKNVWYD